MCCGKIVPLHFYKLTHPWDVYLGQVRTKLITFMTHCKRNQMTFSLQTGLRYHSHFIHFISNAYRSISSWGYPRYDSSSETDTRAGNYGNHQSNGVIHIRKTQFGAIVRLFSPCQTELKEAENYWWIVCHFSISPHWCWAASLNHSLCNKGLLYPAWPLPWLLMIWWHNEPNVISHFSNVSPGNLW